MHGCSVMGFLCLKDSSVNGIIVGAEEEVGLPQHALDGMRTLVLIGPDEQSDTLMYEETANIIAEEVGEGLEQTLLLEKQLLHQQNELLRREKDSLEKRLQAEIQQLKDQVASLVQSNVKMFEELQLYRNVESNQQRVNELVESLESQHRELLQTQLVTLRKELLGQVSTISINGHTGLPELTACSENGSLMSLEQTEMVEEEGGEATLETSPLTTLEMVEVQLNPAQEDLEMGLVGFVSTQEGTVSGQENPDLDNTERLQEKHEDSQLCRKRTNENESEGGHEAKLRCIC